MSRSLAITAVAGTILSLVGSAQGQIIDWNNPAGGSWHVAANWLPTNEPDNAGETARFSLLGTYGVDLTVSRTISDLLILNSGTSLRLNAGASLRVNNVVNTGRVTINANGGGTATPLVLTSGASTTGNGEFVLNATQGVLDRAYIQPSLNDGFWTNGAGHTVRGRGRAYYGLHNEGALRADQPGEVLEVVQGTILNSGVIESTTGVLQLNAETVDQTGGGAIVADASGADARFLGSTTVIGGTISATSGVVSTVSGTTTLSGVRLAGTYNINTGCTAAVINGLEQNGVLTINAQGGGAATAFSIAEGSTLSGAGTVLLNATQGSLDRAQIYAPTRGAWTHAQGRSIVGRGRIYYNLVNNGVISATFPGEMLEMVSGAVTNSGTLRAIGGGVLQLSGESVAQTPVGVLTASDGSVRLVSSSITGGTISAAPGSAVSSAAGTQTLTDVAITGAFNIDVGCGVQLLGVTNHSGVMLVNTQGGGTATPLLIAAGAALNGPGTVVLNATQGVLDRALMYAPSHAAWIHGAGHTVRGRGNMYYDLVNNGTIIADMPGEVLQMISGTATNNGLIEARDGGVLQLSSETVTQTASGVVSATSGPVRLLNATISGGALNSNAANHVLGAVGTQTLTGGVLLSGPLDVLNGTTLSLPTGLMHSGTITLNLEGGGTATPLLIAAGTTISGPGEVVLNATQGVLDRALMYSPSHAAWTNAAGHTVRGRGNLYYDFVNNGVVTADQAGSVLQLQLGTVTNNGIIAAANDGVLQLNQETVIQPPAGVISASGGPVSLIGSTVSGGALSSSNGRRVTGLSGTQTLSGGVTVTGLLDINSGAALSLPGGLTNHATITLNATGGGTATPAIVGAGTTLSGTGRLVLLATQGVLDRSYITCSGAMSNGPGHTIAGTGNVYATWTNHGTVRPSGPSRRIDCQSGPFTQASDGVYEVELGGLGAAQHGLLAGPQAKVLGGLLRVVLTDGFLPRPCDLVTVITGPITGEFDSYDFPTLPLGGLHAIYSANSVTLSYIPADFNGDGFPDFFDYGDFVAAFESGDPAADFNHDGFIDFFDYADFLTAFESGC